MSPGPSRSPGRTSSPPHLPGPLLRYHLAAPHIISGAGIILPVKPLCALAREPGIFTSMLRTGLSQVAGVSVVAPMSPDLSAGITHWGVGGLTGRQLQDKLWTRRKIRVRAGGDKVVRQSTHIYNNLAEIEATIGVAKALAER